MIVSDMPEYSFVFLYKKRGEVDAGLIPIFFNSIHPFFSILLLIVF